MTNTTMTQEKILRLAFRQAVLDWGEHKILGNHVSEIKFSVQQPTMTFMEF